MDVAGPHPGASSLCLPCPAHTGSLSPQDCGAALRGSGGVMGAVWLPAFPQPNPGKVRAPKSYCSFLTQSKCPVPSAEASCNSGPAQRGPSDTFITPYLLERGARDSYALPRNLGEG